MINSSKNYYFIFISILLSFIISIFYNKIMDIKFLLIFITLSLFLYIVFYYLGTTKENYIDYNPYHDYDSSNNHIIRHNLEGSEEMEEESRIDIIKDFIKSKKDNIFKLEHQEEETYPSIQEETYPPIQEETKNSPFDFNKFVFDNPIKNGNPLNINIKDINFLYNSQNRINEIDNNTSKDYNKENKCNERKENKSKNLGNNCDNSRIYNNSDWIYGSSAWTNEPDYYIPEKNKVKEISQPLNELINTKKYKENKNVCPLMINTPWTEYKSGDSEPEPYNL